MSSFPPFPPNGRYSPSTAYNDTPASFSYQPNAPSFPTFDAYTNETPRPPFPYEQPRRPYDSEIYDPYQPSSSNAYDPGVPSMRPPTASFASRPPTAPPRVLPLPPPRHTQVDAMELTLLTETTTAQISGQTVNIYALPPSHLPIKKFVGITHADAIEIHRRLCMSATSIWYADGSSRAGEAWSAAIEWIIDSARSGSKMRGNLGAADALDAELGGICKAAEGFQELLHQSIKDGKPVSHELIVFCDSQAAIVAIDTSSRPEALRFDKLWRTICSEFLKAELKLAWLPKGTSIEGHVLADKIATVGASNSYLKRKKENTLPDIYKRPGGGEPAPGGSTEAGPWQRGDADPSRRKSPYERPKALVLSPAPDIDHGLHLDTGSSTSLTNPTTDADEDAVQSREGSIFVTHFPDEVSAKDIGILFAQYGNIVAVDIYHISQGLPRFANVAYTDPQSGLAAIADLSRQPINLDTTFARENYDDLEVWRKWNGQLTVVLAEPPRLVPTSVAADFPNLPDWASRDQRRDEREVDMQMTSQASPASNRKRDRQDRTPSEHSPKRFRQGLPSQPINIKLEPGLPNTQPNHPSNQLMPPFPPNNALMPDSHRTSPQARPLLPPTPITAEPVEEVRQPSESTGRRPLTNSASEPQEYPIKVGSKTIRAQIDIVRRHFGKVHVSNWIAHSCFIASEIDQARRALQEDLYATDTGFLAGRDLEKTLSARGFTPQRVDAFITKVLKVLDGIAMAEADEDVDGEKQENVEEVEKELDSVLSVFPDQTKEAVASAARLMEYLLRGKEAQEKKRLEVERRVKVLEGMVKVGEVVTGVVRYLLSDDK